MHGHGGSLGKVMSFEITYMTRFLFLIHSFINIFIIVIKISRCCCIYLFYVCCFFFFFLNFKYIIVANGSWPFVGKRKMFTFFYLFSSCLGACVCVYILLQI